MAKTHTLRAVFGGELVERKVDATERLLVKTGGTLESFKIGELAAAEYGTWGDSVQITTDDGRGRFIRLGPGSRLELGEDRFPVAELGSFLLSPIPKPAEPEPAPISRTFLVRFLDGREEVVELAGSPEIRGTVYPGGEAMGWEVGWNEGKPWGVRLDDVDTFERIEPEGLAQEEPAEELEGVPT
jgi:hypothetical protein